MPPATRFDLIREGTLPADVLAVAEAALTNDYHLISEHHDEDDNAHEETSATGVVAKFCGVTLHYTCTSRNSGFASHHRSVLLVNNRPHADQPAVLRAAFAKTALSTLSDDHLLAVVKAATMHTTASRYYRGSCDEKWRNRNM